MNLSAPKLRFNRRQRLTKDAEFQSVYSAKVRKTAGPFIIFARPNGLQWARLGLSVSRRVGGAIRRNRVKRLLRESFRLDQHGLPPLDFVVTVRPHDDLTLEQCRGLFLLAAGALDTEWQRRDRRGAKEPESPP